MVVACDDVVRVGPNAVASWVVAVGFASSVCSGFDCCSDGLPVAGEALASVAGVPAHRWSVVSVAPAFEFAVVVAVAGGALVLDALVHGVLHSDLLRGVVCGEGAPESNHA